MDEEKSRSAFFKWLMHERCEKHSCMVDRAEGEKIIQYLKEKRDLGDDDPSVRCSYDSVFRKNVKKKSFKLLTVVGLGDILCLPMKQAVKSSAGNHAMLGQNRQVIFKEDMYDVINDAHIHGTKHLGYKGTFKKLNETYCNIPRVVVCKFVELCAFCTVHHACYASKQHKSDRKEEPLKIVKNLRKKLTFPDAFLTRCQIDIIDMIKTADGDFSYIGHFFDHHSRYNVLFPLKTKDAAHVVRKLCRHVFGHFGLPKILYSTMPRDFVDGIIHWIKQLWSTDLPVINGDPGNKKAMPFVEQRQRTMMALIDTFRMKHPNSNEWASWLPCIQYSLNTNEFEHDTSPSYDVVFQTRPRYSSCSLSTSQILWEESLLQSDDDENKERSFEDTQDLNENPSSVTSTAFPGLKITVSNSILPLSAVQAQDNLPNQEAVDSPEVSSDVEDYDVTMVQGDGSLGSVDT